MYTVYAVYVYCIAYAQTLSTYTLLLTLYFKCVHILL